MTSWSSSPTADAASAVADAATAASAAISSIDPSGIYGSNLVTSALSTIGDAQFFEESISPSTVRTQLVVTGDPSNPSTTLDLLKGMKWLLANMSKGRNVSDFFPHVVKLVGAPNLEVRKMVYIYLARYANHDGSCRELALLSINAFQQGLADREPLLRSLALRVLTCMDVPDVLQLQILGVRTCCKDSSPYVRKCAANAVGKLHPRCLAAGDGVQAEQLVDIVKHLLEEDGSTMVLTSAMVAFSEICPGRLDLLHGCYRKICHLLTDMDEWGQVVVIEALMQYCRTFFKQPWGNKKGSAERIDQERRVTRSSKQLGNPRGSRFANEANILGSVETKKEDALLSPGALTLTNANGFTAPAQPHPRQKPKRRVVRKAFYSDEEDESTEEEVDPNYPITRGNIAGTLREHPILGSSSAMGNTLFRDDAEAAVDGSGQGDLGWKSGQDASLALDDEEDSDFDKDHKLLLDSSFPLLKSRNSAVVLATCSLHYHCGLASIKIRTALGKALVRIHRNRREIQYIVLVSIRTLVRECPSAFSPFLSDFFVKGMEPSFTRMIKVDILVCLCIDPKAIDIVLTELSSYARHRDKIFACAAIRAAGKVAELARVVYDRRAQTVEKLDALSARADSNIIVLNCLSGLVTLSEFSRISEVVGECAETIQSIFSQIFSDDGLSCPENDPAGIKERALNRLLLILINSLGPDTPGDIGVDKEKTIEQTQLQQKTVYVPDSAVASILWVISEWLTREGKSKSKIRFEVLRLLAKSFGGLNPRVKLQAIHLASKVLLKLKADDKTSSPDTSKKECAISELILAMARVDVLQDVRDRARHESNILHMSIGLVYGATTLQQLPSNTTYIGVDTAESMLLHRKPNASSLPLDDSKDLFRFGTFIMCNRTMGSALPLPTWAEVDSPGALRDASTANKPKLDSDGTELYSSSSDDESYSSSSKGSSSSSSDDSSEESGDGSCDSESMNTNKTEKVDSTLIINGGFRATQPEKLVGRDTSNKSEAMVPSVINNEADAEASFDSSSDTSNSRDVSEESNDSTENGEINANTILDMESTNLPQVAQTNLSSNVAAGLEDLVMAPLVKNEDDSQSSTIDDESGAWKVLVRPELSGGLFVKMRFVHGQSRTKEARLLGIDPENPSTVCLQVHFENMRTESGILRHVRILHRGTSRGMIFPSKVITPPEIPVLKKGMASTVFVGITFSSASDRDGVVLAKFDVKSDHGTTSVEVRPTLGELLKDESPKTTTQPNFNDATSRLQGIQCISTAFRLPLPMNDSNFKNLPSTILQHVNLKQIGEWTSEGKGTFVGTLPSSGQEVYVAVTCDSVTGYGDLTVSSNDAMAANSITNLLKQALASQRD